MPYFKEYKGLAKKKLLEKILNSNKNVHFNDLVTLITAFGFTLIRNASSHHIYEHKDIAEMVNIQNDKGKAKPYQIKQFLQLVEKYKLNLEE